MDAMTDADEDDRADPPVLEEDPPAELAEPHPVPSPPKYRPIPTVPTVPTTRGYQQREHRRIVATGKYSRLYDRRRR